MHRPREQDCSHQSIHRGIRATKSTAHDPPQPRSASSISPANREENHNIQNVFTQPGSFTSLWLLGSTVRMSASHPKATESLRGSENDAQCQKATSFLLAGSAAE